MAPAPRNPATRPAWIRLGVLALIVVAAYATMAFTGNVTPKLGLDLQGGTTVTLTPVVPGGGTPPSGSVDKAVDIIRQRVNALGVSSAEVKRVGDKIEISVPGKGREDVLNLVGTTAELQFREVVGSAAGTPTPTPTPSGSPADCPHADCEPYADGKPEGVAFGHGRTDDPTVFGQPQSPPARGAQHIHREAAGRLSGGYRWHRGPRRRAGRSRREPRAR